MIDRYFTTIKQDFNIVKAYFSNDGSDKDIEDIDFKVRHASLRLFNTGIMALGIGIVFFALPIVSSGVSIVGLIVGVAAFIFGHDVFKVSLNFQDIALGPTTVFIVPNEQEMKQIHDDMEKGTILKPLLRHTRQYWHPWIMKQIMVI